MPFDRRANLFLVVVFLATIIAPGLIQTAREIQDGETPRVLEIFRQPPTARNLHAYEHGLEGSSYLIKQFRPWMQYVQWKVFADAGETVVLGRNGWLFYRPSVRYVTERPTAGPEKESADPLPAIRSFRDQLLARGLELLVVVAPNKECIYPEMLAARAETAGVIVCEQTRGLLEQFDKSGIQYVDLFDVFRHAKRDESRPNPNRLYLAHDTHWTPDGANLAAAAVARRVLAQVAVHRGDHVYHERLINVRHLGDLVQMLQVRWIEREVKPESIACRQVIESDSNTPYGDSSESEILILGDSFLRIYERDESGSAGFIARLAWELRQPLTTIVNDGGGSTLVRQALARRPTLLTNKKLVIWEFAEREIRDGLEGWQVIPLDSSKKAAR
jgi:hypothetical protein